MPVTVDPLAGLSYIPQSGFMSGDAHPTIQKTRADEIMADPDFQVSYEKWLDEIEREG